jgi:hypothetical protein
MGIKKRRFFILVGQCKKDPANFSIQYMRRIKTRAIDPVIESNIMKELEIDKNIIQNTEIPLR